MATRARETWFDAYKDVDEDIISPEGANRFFNDLGVSLETVCKMVYLCDPLGRCILNLGR
jgi:hypothetical protein